MPPRGTYLWDYGYLGRVKNGGKILLNWRTKAGQNIPSIAVGEGLPQGLLRIEKRIPSHVKSLVHSCVTAVFVVRIIWINLCSS